MAHMITELRGPSPAATQVRALSKEMQEWFSWVHLAHGPVSEKDKLQIPLEEKQYINSKGKDGNTDHRNNLGRC